MECGLDFIVRKDTDRVPDGSFEFVGSGFQSRVFKDRFQGIHGLTDLSVLRMTVLKGNIMREAFD
jgi:hypothetical protein